MSPTERRRLLAAAAAALVAIFLLSGALPLLRLKPSSLSTPQGQAEALWLLQFIASPQVSFLLTICLLPFALLTGFLILFSYRREKKKGSRRSLAFEAFLWGLAIVALRLFLSNWQPAGSNAPPQPTMLPEETPLPAFELNYEGSPLLAFGVAAGLLVLAAGLGVWFYFRRSRLTQGPLAQQIREQAESSIQEIYAGKRVNETIQRCYAEMCQIINEQRSLQRQPGMTVREFEASMAAAGLPKAPIHELTRLFETFRYSPAQASSQEEARAVACLSAIAGIDRPLQKEA